MKKTLGTLLSIVLLLTAGAFAQNKISLTASSTDCSTAGSCYAVNLNQSNGGVVIGVVIGGSGTLQFEGYDGQQWSAANAYPLNSTTGVTSTTASGLWQVNVAGYAAIRVRCSTFGSAPITVTLNPSTASARAGGGGGGGALANKQIQIDFDGSGLNGILLSTDNRTAEGVNISGNTWTISSAQCWGDTSDTLTVMFANDTGTNLFSAGCTPGNAALAACTISAGVTVTNGHWINSTLTVGGSTLHSAHCALVFTVS